MKRRAAAALGVVATALLVGGIVLWVIPQRTPLVTAATARSVATRLFRVWQQDLTTGNAAGLKRVESGVQLEWDTVNCASTGYVLQSKCPDAPLKGLAVIVPRQYSYPVRVLAEVQTIEGSEKPNSDVITPTPALELLVLTKASSSAPWYIAFQTSLWSTGALPPPVLPAPKLDDGLAPEVTPVQMQNATALPAKLAAYWQSWKLHNAPPPRTSFLPGPFTTSFGALLGSEPDGPVSGGLIQHVTYSSTPSRDGAFAFPVGFGEFTSDPTPGGIGYAGKSGTLVCSAIRVAITFTPQANGEPIVQGPTEIDFGPGLAPGLYSVVFDQSVHESCVLSDGDHLSALGDDGDVFHQSGVPEGPSSIT
jgi:hypothetical protein